MIRRRHRSDGTEIALTNFALTFAKALLVLCVAMFLLINPNQGQDGTKPKAEYLVSIEWTGTVRDDVDLWLRAPDDTRVSFSNKESGVIFLERDDLGTDCQTTTDRGGSVNTCQEITVIRGVVPGVYQTAVHLFSAANSSTPTSIQPVKIAVKIEKLNPTTKIVWQGVVELDRVRQEMPVVQFEIKPDGSVEDFVTTDLPPIVYQGKDAP